MSVVASDRGNGFPAARAARAEWLKLRTLPSNPITVSAAMLLSARAGETTATTELLAGVSWAQFLLAVLAVVTICSEWASGTSTVTFLAAPTRWPVLAGKATVVGVAAGVAGVLGTAGALVLGAAAGIDVGADPALAIRLVAGAGLYLGTVAVLALGVGAIVRDLVGGILAAVGLIGAAPILVSLIPVPEVQRLALSLPAPAGGLLLAPEGASADLTPWGGYAVLVAWATAALAGAVIALRARDI